MMTTATAPHADTATKIKIYAKNIAVPLALGAAVGLLTRGGDAFKSLNKPALAPPAIVFPIVWSILYALMGVSYSRLELRRLNDDGTKLIYYTQLVFNLLWPIAFFALGWRLFALIWIILLDLLVAAMFVRFYRTEKLSGQLQIPYLVWVLFATYLNAGFYVLNR